MSIFTNEEYAQYCCPHCILKDGDFCSSKCEHSEDYKKYKQRQEEVQNGDHD